MSRYTFSVAALAVTAVMAFAAGPTIESVRFGEPLIGTKLDKDAVKGRVVLVELWGVH